MSDTAVGRLPVGRLLVLAAAVFSTMSTEFLPTGLLPEMAADLGVTEPVVGQLLTIFAVTVAVTAWPLALATRKLPRKQLLVVVLALFAVTNLLCAIVPEGETGYAALVGLRVLGGILHGLTWGIAIPYTAALIDRRQIARGMTITNSGASLAFLIGMPITAAVGHATDWRVSFAGMGVVILGLALLTALALPPVASHTMHAPAPAGAPRDRSLIAVVIVAVTVLFVATGHNTFYAYIVPWTIDAGVEPGLVSVVLLACGIAGFLGLVSTAIFADRWPRATFTLMVSLMLVGILALALWGSGLVAVLLLGIVWSLGWGGLPAQFNARALHDASPRVRVVTGAVIASGFNLAIAIGGLLGGLVFTNSGVQAVPWWALGIVAAGLVWVLSTDRARARLASEV